MSTQVDQEGAITDVRRAFLNPVYDVEREPLETRRTSQYWAKPYRRRISEYEQLLMYAQPNPDWIPGGLGFGGWRNKYTGGRGAWENYFTEAKSSDWYAFRDPSMRGQPTYVAQKTAEWEETERQLTAYAQQGLWRELDAEWALQVLPTVYGAYAHHEYGLFMSLASPARDALTDVLRVAIITGALDHLDNAEMIQAEKVFLAKIVDGFSADVAPAREFWTSSPTYRAARTVVERVWGDVFDHIESVFATFMVHEPLFGRFARQQFFHRMAPLHGDQLTPSILWASITASEIDAKWAFELFRHALAGDPKFGEYNRKLMRMWARDWLELTIQAMSDFAPTFLSTERLRASVTPDDVERSALTVIGDWAKRYASVFDFDVDVDELARRVRSALPASAAR